jgi:AcrR family transcriptional regulator
MDVKPNHKKRKKPKDTFIERARRKQILEIAIEEIESKGFKNTTIQQIANKANISKGVIYYHFNGLEELLSNIWALLIDELFTYRKQRVEEQHSAEGKLSTYVKANFKFLKKNQNKLTALFHMGIDLNTADFKTYPWSIEVNQRCFDYLKSLLVEGQKNGEFRRFSTEIIAPIIQGAVDGLCLQWVSSPELIDLEACIDMLLEIIKQYTAVETTR